jgi:acyl carrier protein
VPDKADIERVVFRAIDRVNEFLPAGVELERSASEPLAGRGSKLDSMGIVNLVCALEDEASLQFGVGLNLMDAEGNDGSPPLETVGSLVSYLTKILNRA